MKFTVKHMISKRGTKVWAVVTPESKDCVPFITREAAEYLAGRCNSCPECFHDYISDPLSDFTEIKPTTMNHTKGRNENPFLKGSVVHKTRNASKSANKALEPLPNRPRSRTAKGNQSLSATRRKLEAQARSLLRMAAQLRKEIKAL